MSVSIYIDVGSLPIFGRTEACLVQINWPVMGRFGRSNALRIDLPLDSETIEILEDSDDSKLKKRIKEEIEKKNFQALEYQRVRTSHEFSPGELGYTEEEMLEIIEEAERVAGYDPALYGPRARPPERPVETRPAHQ